MTLFCADELTSDGTVRFPSILGLDGYKWHKEI